MSLVRLCRGFGQIVTPRSEDEKVKAEYEMGPIAYFFRVQSKRKSCWKELSFALPDPWWAGFRLEPLVTVLIVIEIFSILVVRHDTACRQGSNEIERRVATSLPRLGNHERNAGPTDLRKSAEVCRTR